MLTLFMNEWQKRCKEFDLPMSDVDIVRPAPKALEKYCCSRLFWLPKEDTLILNDIENHKNLMHYSYLASVERSGVKSSGWALAKEANNSEKVMFIWLMLAKMEFSTYFGSSIEHVLLQNNTIEYDPRVKTLSPYFDSPDITKISYSLNDHIDKYKVYHRLVETKKPNRAVLENTSKMLVHYAATLRKELRNNYIVLDWGK